MQQVRSRHRVQGEQLPQTLLQAHSKQRQRRKKRANSYHSWLVDALHRYGYIFALLGATFVLVLLLPLTQFPSAKRELRDVTSQSPKTILLPVSQNTKKFHKPTSSIHVHPSPNFGDVSVNLFTNDGMTKLRRIYRNLDEERGVSVDSKYPKSEHSFFDYIYNFDDDYQRNPLWAWDDDKIQDEKTCRRNAWHRRNPMDCNSMHELDLLDLMTEGKMNLLG